MAGYAHGADAFVPKPLDFAALMAVLGPLGYILVLYAMRLCGADAVLAAGARMCEREERCFVEEHQVSR